MCISGIYSLNNEVVNSTESTISTGVINIDLKEYDENGELFTGNNKIVMPGEVIPLIPRVSNLGEECYLRTSITYTINGDKVNELDFVNGNYLSWDFEDGYYYYGSALGKGESIDLFNELSIPDDIDIENQNGNLAINIKVEAVQAKNFDGDWNGVEIKESVDRSYEVDGSSGSVVVYENGAENYLSIDEDFFDNLGSLLPGDSVSEEVEILNSSEDEFKYYLTVELKDLTEEEENLLKNINLVIRNSENEELVNTDLASVGEIILGDFDVKDTDKLVFEISLPKELDNDFSNIFTKITWKFSLELLSIRENPKTWDLKFDLSITVFLLSAIGFIVVLFLERKEAEK